MLSGLRSVGVLLDSDTPLDPLPKTVPLVQAFSRPRPPPSGLSLSQLLADMDVAVDDLVIRDASGEAIARYDHGARILWSLEDRPLAAIASRLDSQVHLSSSYGPIRVGGSSSTSSLGGIRGAWASDLLQLPDGWSYAHGRVIRGQRTALWLDGAPPPALLPVLVDLLAVCA